MPYIITGHLINRPGLNLRLAGLLLMASMLGGCLPLPYVPYDPHKISQETMDSIKPGSSTRTDVLLTLSDPDVRGEKDGHFIYNWLKGHAGLVFIMGGGGGAGPVAAVESNSCISLAIRFAQDGKVVAMKQFIGEPKGSGEMLLGNEGSGSRGGCSSAVMSRDIDAWLKEPTP